jgi:valyl-tRNA synthetase
MQTRVEALRPFIAQLAGVESIEWLRAGTEPPASATGLCSGLEIFVPLAGLIDREGELARLDKEITRLRGDIERIEKKLANENFVARAPEAVVDKERRKRDDQRQALEKLMQQRERVSAS